MNYALKNTAIDAAADDQSSLEKAVRTLTDLELMLAAGGDSPICWGQEPPPAPPAP